MLGLISFCVFLLFGCAEPLPNNDMKSTEIPTTGKQVKRSTSDKIKDEDFNSFISSFTEKELPIIANSGYADDFKIFTVDSRDSRKIDRETAIKHLCGGDMKLSKEPEGGLYEYYYGYRFSSDNFICVLYYKPSVDYFNGYYIATFDFSGNLISNQVVAGDLWEQSQLESVITKDYEIKSIELLYTYPKVESYKEIEAYRVNKYYKITDKGEIVFQKEDDMGQVTCIVTENGRLIIKE